MTVHFKDCRLAGRAGQTEARLVFHDDQPACIFEMCDDDGPDAFRNHWRLVTGFGPCRHKEPPPFFTFEHATVWVENQFREGEAPDGRRMRRAGRGRS